MISDLVQEFLEDYLDRTPYLPDNNPPDKLSITTKQDLINILSSVELIIRWNKGKPIEQVIEALIRDNIDKFETIRKKYGVPGYTASIKVGNYNVKLYGGNINYLGEPMPENALFDIASMTKFYTQIIAYNLINEGLFNRSDKIRDLDDRFVNLGDLTVDEILTFATTFRTDGALKDKKEINEALDALYNVVVTNTGKYDYNDMGMMIMKELMERLTGLSYEELVNKYIVGPLGLEDTHVIVPNAKYHLLTGSPNASVGNINDMTANAVGGYSGHAGIFASSDDIIKVVMEAAKKNSQILPHNEDTYTPNKLVSSRSVMGNVYRAHPTGIYDSFVDTTEPIDTFAISGSTRTNAAASSDSAYTVLFNPSSISFQDAKDKMDKINEERKKLGKNPVYPVREFEFNRNGELIKRKLIDPRLVVLPVDPMAKAVQSIAYTTLKLRFLDFVMKKQAKNLEEVNFNKNVR